VPSIVGTWKLVRAVARDGSGATLPEPYGGKGIGRVTFTADGRMQSMVCDGRKEMPAGVARDYSSYCGNYTFDGTRLGDAGPGRPRRRRSCASRAARDLA
jgi:hypothetical protein